MQAAIVVFSAGLVAKPASYETVSAASGALPLSMLTRGSTFKRRCGAWISVNDVKSGESVLVVTGGKLDARAWLITTGTPISPLPVLTQPQACPRAWGFLQIGLRLLHYVIAATSHQGIPQNTRCGANVDGRPKITMAERARTR